jgi:hypothetical protein
VNIVYNVVLLIPVLVFSMAITDFWWLTDEQVNKYFFVKLVHHQPLTDEDSAPNAEFTNPCFTQIRSISKWCENHQNTNIYRSLEIWTDNLQSEALYGPFVIDIDNDENLDDALTVTRNTIEYIVNLYNLKESDIRSFFTGHKGFNIEVLPSALGLLCKPSRQDEKANCIREKIICELRKNACLSPQLVQVRNCVSKEGTIIDCIHDYLRLHNSINKWIENVGRKARRKIGITLSEVNSLSLNDIIDRSKI